MAYTPTFDDLNQQVAELKSHMLQTTKPREELVWSGIFSRPMVDGLPAGFGYYNDEMILLRHNRIYSDFLEKYSPYHASEYVGQDHYILKPGSRTYSENMFRHVLDSRRAITCYDFELHINMNGEDHVSMWDVHIAPVLDESGRTRGMLMFCLDLTERKLYRQTAPDTPSSCPTCLADMKATLRTLLRLREEEKKEQEERVTSNIRRRIRPHLDKLRNSRLDKDQLACLDEIGTNLQQLTSSFTQPSLAHYYRLTPRELRIAELIRDGCTSKEIAQQLQVSKSSIEFHRNNIRKKLGLDKGKINLQSYLLSLHQ